MHAEFTMEDLFEFLFGASGRINRAKYWRSLLTFSVAGLFAAVILFTAAGIAAPLFIIMVVVVFIPWLIWGFAIHTERLHDRDKSAWWLLLFYGAPALLGQFAKAAWIAGVAGTALHYILALAGFALTIWDLSRSAACAAPPGPTNMAPTRLRAERHKSASCDGQATIARGT
jgi:uncharacterized membrane protein YhaH (DUF805 family)